MADHCKLRYFGADNNRCRAFIGAGDASRYAALRQAFEHPRYLGYSREDAVKQSLIVALREFTVTLRRPSFYAAVLIAPLIVGAIFFGLSIVGDEFNDDAQRDFAATLNLP